MKSFIAQDTLANTMPHLLCCGLTTVEEMLMQKKTVSLVHKGYSCHMLACMCDSTYTQYSSEVTSSTLTNLGFPPLQALPPAPPPFPSERTPLLVTIAPHSCHPHLQEEDTSDTVLSSSSFPPPLLSSSPTLTIVRPSPLARLLFLHGLVQQLVLLLIHLT